VGLFRSCAELRDKQHFLILKEGTAYTGDVQNDENSYERYTLLY
jgi:hypothetical protein